MNTPQETDMTGVTHLQGVPVTEQDLADITKAIQHNLNRLFEFPLVRYQLAKTRFQRQMTKAEVKTVDNPTDYLIQNAVDHNLQGLATHSALARPDKLINVLKSTDTVLYRGPQMKVLSVGPRSESEIFSLIGAGFRAENVRGLDLISYSPYVDLGDMHAMPYADRSFDLVILGWVLAYSTDNPKAVSEVLRVAKPGALIAIGCEYNPKSSEDLAQSGGVLKTDYPRYYHTDDILKLFEGRIKSVIFRHDIRPELKNMVGAIMTIFEIA